MMPISENTNQDIQSEKMEALREAMQRKGKVNLLEEKLATILLKNFPKVISHPSSK